MGRDWWFVVSLLASIVLLFVIFAVQNRIPVLEDSALSQPPAAPVGDFVVPDAGGSTKAAAGSTASVAV